MSCEKQVKAENCHCNLPFPVIPLVRNLIEVHARSLPFKQRAQTGVRRKIQDQRTGNSPENIYRIKVCAHLPGCWCDGRHGPGSLTAQWAGRWGCPLGSRHRGGYTGTERRRSSQIHRSCPGTSSRMDLVLSGDSLLSPTGFMERMRKVLSSLWNHRDLGCQNPIV